MNKPALVLVACVLVSFAVAPLFAQEPAPAPKPGPEHQKLAYYIGKWNSEGDIKASAAGPAGKYAYTETCDWLPGKFAILCKQDGNIMGGEFHGTSVMSYDAMQNSYLYYATNNWGENSYYHGTVDGDTWTWLNEGKANGQTISARFVLKQVSPDLATFTFALAFGGQPLNNIMEGRQTRQK